MAALALVRAVTLPVTRGELVAAARAKLAKANVGLAGLADHAAHENAALAKVRQEQAEREFSGISGSTVLAARSLLRRIREVVSAHPEWEIGPSGPSLEIWRDLVVMILKTRRRWSRKARPGLGYSMKLHLAYLGPKYVWPKMGWALGDDMT